jgi:D-serine deaminase-like pyridoxal phosphate-dependent protein
MGETSVMSNKVSFTGRGWPIPLAELPTPVLTIDTGVLTHNIETMAEWCRGAGVDLAPHGKTTMSPEIWRQQLDAGAWGITVATAYQAEVAREAGVQNVILAGTSFSPDALARLATPGAEVLMWVDSIAAVNLVDEALGRAGSARSLPILVELGAPGGRTGVRTIEGALAIATAVQEADNLVLAGVAGYEGALSHATDPAALRRIDDYLAGLIELRDRLDGDAFAEWLDRGGDVVLTAGGSVYFDRVVDALGYRHDPRGERGARTRVVLRSGSYVTHDHDLYRRLTPFARTDATETFLPALDLWASVLSRPDPTLALLNVGRRDTADDEGLPLPIEAYRGVGDQARRIPGAVDGARVTGLNDQHAFVSLPADSALAVGDLVRLGISHPCTTIDKWSEIATIPDGRGGSRGLPAVTGSLVTRF